MPQASRIPRAAALRCLSPALMHRIPGNCDCEAQITLTRVRQTAEHETRGAGEGQRVHKCSGWNFLIRRVNNLTPDAFFALMPD